MLEPLARLRNLAALVQRNRPEIAGEQRNRTAAAGKSFRRMLEKRECVRHVTGLNEALSLAELHMRFGDPAALFRRGAINGLDGIVQHTIAAARRERLAEDPRQSQMSNRVAVVAFLHRLGPTAEDLGFAPSPRVLRV